MSSDKEKIGKIVQSLGLRLPPVVTDAKSHLQFLFNQWLPLSQAVLGIKNLCQFDAELLLVVVVILLHLQCLRYQGVDVEVSCLYCFIVALWLCLQYSTEKAISGGVNLTCIDSVWNSRLAEQKWKTGSFYYCRNTQVGQKMCHFTFVHVFANY